MTIKRLFSLTGRQTPELGGSESWLPQQFRQLRDIRCDPSRLVTRAAPMSVITRKAIFVLSFSHRGGDLLANHCNGQFRADGK